MTTASAWRKCAYIITCGRALLQRAVVSAETRRGDSQQLASLSHATRISHIPAQPLTEVTPEIFSRCNLPRRHSALGVCVCVCVCLHIFVCVYLSACTSVYSMHTGYLELSVSKPMRFHLAV